MTTLTLNGSAAAASTLAAAGKLFNATGGTSGNTSTKVGSGSGTNYKQIFAKGTSTGQGNGVTSIPAPTDSNFNGWMWDVTTLEGQLLQAGTLTPTIHLLASTGTTVTPTVTWYKRSSGGAYTQLATVTGSSIALTTSSQALTFTAPSMSDTAFSVGDKLVMWLWVNQTAGGATNSTISVVEATSASSAGVASEAQTVTAGYIPIVTTTYSFTEALIASSNKPTTTYSAVVLADSPIRYYRLGESSGPVLTDSGSQAQNGTPNGTLTYGQVGLIAQDPNQAMLFDGSTGYISIPTTGLPTGASAWTMEAWIELSSLPTAGTYPMVIYLGTQVAGKTASIYYNGDNAQIQLGVDSAPDLLGGALVVNTIYHVVGTYDGTTIRFYVNGVLKDSKTITLNMTYGVAYIGNDPSSHFWTKYIDEPAIYSVALSLGQVLTHYQAGISTFGTLTATDTDIPIDSLTAAESLLVTDTDVPIESLITSDFGNMQAWGIDALTISDRALISGTSLSTDALTASDTLLASGGSSYTEASSASENFLGSDISQVMESLTATDALLEAGNYSGTGNLSASDSQVSGGAYIPLEGLTGATSPLKWDVYLPTDDALVADDSASTMTQDAVGGGVVTTTYSFEDDLSITDTFTGKASYGPVDVNTGSDAFIGQNSASMVEANTALDTLLMRMGYAPFDTLSLADAYTANGAYLPVDGLSLLDIFHALIIAGVPGTAVILDQLIALALLGDRLVSIASLSDREVSLSTPQDSLLAGSVTSEQSVATATLSDELG